MENMSVKLNRRKFLKSTTLFGSALATSTAIYANTKKKASNGNIVPLKVPRL